MQCKLVGAFDKDNDLTGLHARLSGQSILAVVRPAIVEQQKGRDRPYCLVCRGGRVRLRVSAFRTCWSTIPCATRTCLRVLARRKRQPKRDLLECFMDELAHAVGQDALEFRRKLMTKRATWPFSTRWPSASADRRRKASIALPHEVLRQLCRRRGGNLIVDGNRVKIHRIVGATDCTYAVNPAQIDRQVAGSFVYGLSALFYRDAPSRTAASCRRTSIPTTRCASPKCRRSKRSSCRPEAASWGSVGEPTICVAAPAVLNAYFRATGQRHASVPVA